MYAPDPQRAHSYLAVYAEFEDGRRTLVAADEVLTRLGGNPS